MLTPACDLIEIIAARGNTSLEPVLSLTSRLRHDIDMFSTRLSSFYIPKLTASALAPDLPPPSRRSHVANGAAPVSVSSQGNARGKKTVTSVMDELNNILKKIEDIVPLLNLALNHIWRESRRIATTHRQSFALDAGILRPLKLE